MPPKSEKENEHQEVFVGLSLENLVCAFCANCLKWEAVGFTYPMVIDPCSEDIEFCVNDLNDVLEIVGNWSQNWITVGLESAPDSRYIAYARIDNRELVRSPASKRPAYAVIFACVKAEEILRKEAIHKYEDSHAAG